MKRYLSIFFTIFLFCSAAHAQTKVRATNQLINAQTGTTYAITAVNAGKLITACNGSSQAYSIAQAGSTGFPSGWFVDIKNICAGTVTITPATSTIDGEATLVLTTGKSLRIVSNGTHYRTGLAGLAFPTATDVSTPQFCSDAGANDTYVCSLAPDIASYVVGTKLRFFANTANTGAASINFNSLGALAIKVLQGTADPANGDIKAGAWVDCTVKVGSICEMTSTLGNAPATGITNSAGAGVVPVSDGTNLVASQITEVLGVLNLTDTNDANVTLNPTDKLISIVTSDVDGDINATGHDIYLYGTGIVEIGTAAGQGGGVFDKLNNQVTLQGVAGSKLVLSDGAGVAVATLGNPADTRIAVNDDAQTIALTAANGVTVNGGAGIPKLFLTNDNNDDAIIRILKAASGGERRLSIEIEPVTTGPGGYIDISAGTGEGASNGGALNISAGSAPGAGTGGALSINGGNGGAGGTGGDVSIAAGDGAVAGGAIYIGSRATVLIGDPFVIGNSTLLTINDVAQTITLDALSVIASTSFKSPLYQTTTNCADSAGAAACGSAAAGSFVVDAAATETVVSTTAVTANSQIFVMFDSSLGARLGVTCNVTVALPAVTARTAGTSFTITVPTAPTSNPACYSYFIVN